MDKLLRNKKAIILFLLPGMILFTLVLFVPIVKVVCYSFTSYSMKHPQLKFVGFDNYKELFTKDEIFMTALKNSLFFMIFSVVTQQTLGLVLAAVLMNLRRGKNFFKNVYYLPTVLSSSALGLMWMFIFKNDMGINQLFGGGPKWLSSTTGFIILPMWIIGFVALWQYIGQTMMLYMAQMSGISKSIYEAASIDGANKWESFMAVTVPLIKPMFLTTLSLNCIGSLKFFDLIFTMTQGGPANKTHVLATHLYKQAFEYFKYGYSSAIAVILLVLCLIISVLLNNVIKVENYEM